MGKSVMADTTKITTHPIGHMAYAQASATRETYFHFTQLVKNYSSTVCSHSEK